MLARIDPQLFCPVKHRSAQAQADLTVIRARAGLVRARTALLSAGGAAATGEGGGTLIALTYLLTLEDAQRFRKAATWAVAWAAARTQELGAERAAPRRGQ
jgi:hypothetical protein